MRAGRSRTDDILIASLAVGATVDAAAAKAVVSPRTVYRRLRSETFQARLQDFKREHDRRLSDAVAASRMEAFRTLLQLLPPHVVASARLGAARCLLDFGTRLRELAELDDRVRRLEKNAHEAAKRRH